MSSTKRDPSIAILKLALVLAAVCATSFFAYWVLSNSPSGSVSAFRGLFYAIWFVLIYPTAILLLIGVLSWADRPRVPK